MTVANASPQNFDRSDVFALEYAGNPQISPDGERIVYERRSNDIMTDATRSNLWLIDTDSGNQRPLVSGLMQAQQAAWSPEGDRIAWQQSTDHGTGLFVQWLDSGQTALLATLRESPSALHWSPDGRMLAFTLPVKGKTPSLAKPPEKPEGAEWAEPVKTIDAVLYRRDGSGFVEPAYTQVFVIPADGGTPRQLTTGDFNHDGGLAWSADGEHLIVSANRNADWEYEPLEADLWSVSVIDGELLRLTDRVGNESSPVVSKDGRRIAYLAAHSRREPYRNEVLHVMNRDGSEDRALTADLDRSVSDPQWAGNGRSLYLQYDDRAERKVARVTLDGNLDTVASALGGTSIGRPYLSGSFSVSEGGTVAFTHGTTYRPANVAVQTRSGPRILTSLNDDLLANRNLGQLHEISYESSVDGETIQG